MVKRVNPLFFLSINDNFSHGIGHTEIRFFVSANIRLETDRNPFYRELKYTAKKSYINVDLKKKYNLIYINNSYVI